MIKAGEMIILMKLDEFESNDFSADECLYGMFDTLLVRDNIFYITRDRDKRAFTPYGYEFNSYY